MLSQITTIDALVPLEVSAQADRLARAKQRQAAAAAAAAQASSSASKTALVSVAGGLTPRGSWSGSSLTGIVAQVTRAADDHDVAGIILDVDSPGGTVSATRPQLRSPWRRQRNLHRGREYARGLGGVLDCLAGRRAGDYAVRRRRLDWRHHHAPGYFRLARPGGDQDGDRSFRESPNKNEAHPLSDKARAYLQGRANEAGADFVKAVAGGRRVSQTKVREEFGQGRMVGAREAVARGMADRIATLDQVISGMLQ
ncbi:ClpP class serine protease [Bradyrhizobium elkanii]|nr:ClpP class serine protease [Bradyrhizobium elkanii]